MKKIFTNPLVYSIILPVIFTVLHDLVLNVNIFRIDFNGFNSLNEIPIILGYFAITIVSLVIGFIIGINLFLKNSSILKFVIVAIPFVMAIALMIYLQFIDKYNFF